MMLRSFLPQLLAVSLMLPAASVCILGSARVALAQEQDPVKEARKNFQRALELEQAKNWSEALKLFREVGGVRMTPQVRFHIALCEESLGKLVAALGGYELALNDAESVGPEFRSDVEAAIAKLRARIPKLVIERGAGAEAASIELDGVTLGQPSIGVEMPIDPGPHNVTATAKGYADFSSTVEVSEGKTETLPVELERLSPEQKREAAASQAERGPSTPARNWAPPLVAFGVGSAALLGSGAFYILRTSAIDSANQYCEDTNSDGVLDCLEEDKAAVNRQLDKARSYNLASGILLGTGIAGIGAGVVLFILTTPKATPAGESSRHAVKPEQARVRVIPAAANAEVGLSVTGQF